MTDRANFSKVCEKFGLACISHKISRLVERNVALDCSKNAREHCQIDKARVFLEQDGVTDRSNRPRVCEKYGLAIAEEFLQQGADIFIVARKKIISNKHREE